MPSSSEEAKRKFFSNKTVKKRSPAKKKHNLTRKNSAHLGCLNHPGCLWSCLCDCENCRYFEERFSIAIGNVK